MMTKVFSVMLAGSFFLFLSSCFEGLHGFNNYKMTVSHKMHLLAATMRIINKFFNTQVDVFDKPVGTKCPANTNANQ